MLLRSPRAARRRRTRTFGALAAAFALSAVAVACGLDAIATKEVSDPPDSSEAGSEASLPPKPDGDPPDAADAEASVDATTSCPTNHAAMVKVDAGGLLFCIDATEVTIGEYEKFVTATGGKVDSGVFDAGAPLACALNSSYTRIGATAGDPQELPAARIDWCDAHDYCVWAGKRLCGKQVAGDASTGEWFAACSNGGQQKFPYGMTFQPTACNESGSVTKPVKSSAGCEGGVPGLFDMNGNVGEWVDNCGATTCSAMGGSYNAGPVSGCAIDVEYPRAQTDVSLGFRCCAAPR